VPTKDPGAPDGVEEGVGEAEEETELEGDGYAMGLKDGKGE